MSLAPDEQRTLITIETRLRRSDLRLALSCAFFAIWAFRRKGPVQERLSPWHSRRRRLLTWTVVAATVSVWCVLGAVLGVVL